MRVSWWGHGTVALTDAGTTVLVDPVTSARFGHLYRRRGPAAPAALAAGRGVAAVLLTHLHADHLHLPSLLRLPPGTRLVGPPGTAAFLRAVRGAGRLLAGLEELASGATTTVGGLRVTAVAAAHDDRRNPWSHHRAVPVEYVTEGTGRVWCGGDTDLHDSLSDLAPVDLALVPVGGWGPNLGPGHLDPARAVEAVRRLRARVAVPIHWGTFWPVGLAGVRPAMFHGPGPRFAELAAAELPDTRVELVEPGGSVTVDPPG